MGAISRIAGAVALGTGGIAWSLLTLRPEPIVPAIIVVVLLCMPRLRGRRRLIGVCLALMLLVSYSPVGITLTDAAGPPHLIECCPWGSPREFAREIEAGTCHYCSDLVSGYAVAPRWFLVW